jgi:exosortase/archaeosortase family protein
MSHRQGKEGLSWSGLKAEWRGWFADKAPVLWFGAKFGLLILLLYLILALPAGDRLLFIDLKANAALADFILRLSGQHTQITNGVIIQSPRFSMAIRRGCDAIEPTWLLCAAILAFPAPLGKKLAGMGIAAIVLQLLNIVRILTLYLIGVYWPSIFNSAHMEVWPAVFILVAIVFFLRWKGVLLEQQSRT